jgi:hypothetical protein
MFGTEFVNEKQKNKRVFEIKSVQEFGKSDENRFQRLNRKITLEIGMILYGFTAHPSCVCLNL